MQRGSQERSGQNSGVKNHVPWAEEETGRDEKAAREEEEEEEAGGTKGMRDRGSENEQELVSVKTNLSMVDARRAVVAVVVR